MEIIIVVAILGILAAIILPVLRRPKGLEARWACQSTLKQLGLALREYVSDYDGRLPNRGYQAQLFPYLNPSPRRVVECPTHARTTLRPALDMTPEFFQIGYWYNGVQLTEGAGRRRGMRVIDLARPAAQIWALGDEGTADRIDRGFLDRDCCGNADVWAALHDGGGNYAFVDGHVKWLRVGGILGVACVEDKNNVVFHPGQQ